MAEAAVNPNLTADLSDPAQYKFWQEDHVRFGDLDVIGHVNNLAMGSYFENARVALLRKVFPNWPNGETLFVLVQTRFDYFYELNYPAQLRIGTRLLSFGRSSMRLGAALYHDTELVAQSTTVSVLINQETRKPVAVPDDLRQEIIRLAG
ncbi:MAG: acyl-CoA thioesterase [Alphaproteobacteria bacterium]|nr:acyl-CoA thioesterase [Alphaproteobacteria bacterium]